MPFSVGSGTNYCTFLFLTLKYTHTHSKFKHKRVYGDISLPPVPNTYSPGPSFPLCIIPRDSFLYKQVHVCASILFSYCCTNIYMLHVLFTHAFLKLNKYLRDNCTINTIILFHGCRIFDYNRGLDTLSTNL